MLSVLLCELFVWFCATATTPVVAGSFDLKFVWVMVVVPVFQILVDFGSGSQSFLVGSGVLFRTAVRQPFCVVIVSQPAVTDS